MGLLLCVLQKRDQIREFLNGHLIFQSRRHDRYVARFASIDVGSLDRAALVCSDLKDKFLGGFRHKKSLDDFAVAQKHFGASVGLFESGAREEDRFEQIAS